MNQKNTKETINQIFYQHKIHINFFVLTRKYKWFEFNIQLE